MLVTLRDCQPKPKSHPTSFCCVGFHPSGRLRDLCLSADDVEGAAAHHLDHPRRNESRRCPGNTPAPAASLGTLAAQWEMAGLHRREGSCSTWKTVKVGAWPWTTHEEVITSLAGRSSLLPAASGEPLPGQTKFRMRFAPDSGYAWP
ncbi:MAG: hypothetical protein CM15mP77_3230 [Synechococcus sp.]|nr:MAG: hypothetical protein CM15mP77_3230 [Synechococcus sp.]